MRQKRAEVLRSIQQSVQNGQFLNASHLLVASRGCQISVSSSLMSPSASCGHSVANAYGRNAPGSTSTPSVRAVFILERSRSEMRRSDSKLAPYLNNHISRQAKIITCIARISHLGANDGKSDGYAVARVKLHCASTPSAAARRRCLPAGPHACPSTRPAARRLEARACVSLP